MKLYLLKALPRAEGVRDPWEPHWDTARRFVVRAENETIARLIAVNNQGDEGYDAGQDDPRDILNSPWVNPEFTSCEELTADGARGLIVRDFLNG